MKKQSLFASFLALTFLGASLLVVGSFVVLRSYLISTQDRSAAPPKLSLVAPDGEVLQFIRPGPGADGSSERTIRFESTKGGDYLLTIGSRRGQERERKAYVFYMYMLAGLVTVLIATGASAGILLWYLRKNSHLAEVVMGELSAGRLGARFPIRRFDEAGHLMTVFNEMAGRIETLVGQVKASEKARLVFFQNLGHDFRTPLGSLRMMTETIHRKGRELDPAKFEEISEASLHEIEYLGKLVDDLVFLAFVEDPSSELKGDAVDLVALVRDEVAALSTIASLKQKMIRLEVDESGGKLEQLGPPDFSRRLIRNVVSNALDFARSDVSVKLSRERGRLRIEISDDGPGFPKEMLEQYGAQRLVQIQHGHFYGRSSMGLGTAIVRSIVARLGGELRVSNSPGAVVDIRLPV